MEEDNTLIFDWRPALRQAVGDAHNGAGLGTISARFHRAVVALVVNVAERFPGTPVVLSGGVFQNICLLDGVTEAMNTRNIEVYLNEQVPANDGGISFGQAAVAAVLASIGSLPELIRESR